MPPILAKTNWGEHPTFILRFPHKGETLLAAVAGDIGASCEIGINGAGYMQAEWALETKYASQGKFGSFANEHPREYSSLFANLDKILGLLRCGNKIGGFRVNFFRSEGDEVYRIGQTAVAHAKESRLYVYPDSKECVMYVLAIGDKDSQSRDILEAKSIVSEIKKSAVGGQISTKQPTQNPSN
jgi:hypothetical protein